MSQEKRSFLADFTDPDKIDFMSHFTPRQHRAWVALMRKARDRNFHRMRAHLELYQRTTRSVMHTTTRAGSEQEVEVLRQNQDQVDRVDEAPPDMPTGVFTRKKKRTAKEVVEAGKNQGLGRPGE